MTGKHRCGASAMNVKQSDGIGLNTLVNALEWSEVW